MTSNNKDLIKENESLKEEIRQLKKKAELLTITQPFNNLSQVLIDKMDAIITQKWLHFGFLASREAWSDIRRTGYPSGLAFPEVAGTITNVPNRWRYPNTEVNYNPYYKEVSAEDTYYHKLFWAK